jgi:hypothetical protein
MQTIDNPSRRAALKAGAIAGAALGLGTLLRDDYAFAAGRRAITQGDIAILQFLLVAEAVETDLWTQYAELASFNPGFRDALSRTDPALAQYAVDTARDEGSHATFIAAYLTSIGVTPVDLSSFYTIMPPAVSGLTQVPRLTNLTSLTIDTSWYYRYRTASNPDFGDTPQQIATIVNRPAIPTSDNLTATEITGIADTALFHFATIEQGGTSLYSQFMPKAAKPDTLRILAGIGPVEAIHFGVFQTSLGGLEAYTSPDGTLIFPDLRNNNLASQSVMPAPCQFINEHLPLNSAVRPTSTKHAGALAAATGLVNSGLFTGQPPAFFSAVVALAQAADAATR